MVKTEESLRKFFYIDKVEFLRSTMEFALRAKGAQVYTVATLENNFYLLDDLAPDLVIFDVSTVAHHLDELCHLWPKNKLVALGEESERQIIEKRVKIFLPKPLVASQLATRLLSLID
ncbi:MAG: hypothetical protein KBD76_00420 [Bacteriovorax sp.]|nr:hypothetical protein [Bacteriovorax sp.]